MNSCIDLMPEEISLRMGSRVKALRLLAGWKRATLAARAGVSEASLRRFEQTGQASLLLVLRVAMSLGRLDEFAGLLDMPPANSIDDLERQATVKIRKRGSK